MCSVVVSYLICTRLGAALAAKNAVASQAAAVVWSRLSSELVASPELAIVQSTLF